MQNITPTGKRVLVERQVVTETTTASGIILTHGLTYDPSRNTMEHIKEVEVEQEPEAYAARVLKVGPEVDKFKSGDLVLVGKYAGIDIYKDRTAVLLNENDILATLD